MRYLFCLTLLLAGCGAQPAPLAATTQAAAAPQAEWLTQRERQDAEGQIRRLLEKNTPDGRIEIDTIDVQQRLLGHRYPFKASKRVIRPLRTFYYRVEGTYDDRWNRLDVDREVEVVSPR
jgi:hypothetical protein